LIADRRLFYDPSMPDLPQDRYLSIGEIATIVGLSASTLRYYETRGLVEPDALGAENGYRRYREETLYRLNFLKSMRDNKLPLKSIRSVLEREDPASLRRALEARRSDVEDELAELQNQRRWLTQTLARLEAEPSTVPTVGLRGARTVVAKPNGEYSFTGFAAARRKLVARVVSLGLVWSDTLAAEFACGEQDDLDWSNVTYTLPVEAAGDGPWVARPPERGVRLVVGGAMTTVYSQTRETLRWMRDQNLERGTTVEWTSLVGTAVSPFESDFRTEIWIPLRNP
jgi:DNA-binding transcriptional MerR regulator